MVAEILDDEKPAIVELRFNFVNKCNITTFNSTPDRVTGVHVCKW